MKTISHAVIEPCCTRLNGEVISTGSIRSLYREFIGDYPKFFKMDGLCRLGLIGSELLLRDIPAIERACTCIALFNKNGSLAADRNFQTTIADGCYFPSPSLFVYTLANIVTGEIAIRHKIYGETASYVLQRYDPELMARVVDGIYLTSTPRYILAGWVEYNDEIDYYSDIRLTTNN